MNSEAVATAANEIRENLVTTAVKFLTNPSVQRCTMESKERFLRNKGLTDIEIKSAIEKVSELVDVPSITSELMFFRHSRRSWFRDNVLPFLVYGGFAYGCYWFYKTVVRPLVFVSEPQRKSTAACIEELRVSLESLTAGVAALRGELRGELRGQLGAVTQDVAAVKGLLLNRNQFPSLLTRPETSIPAWQRQAEEASSTEPRAEPAPHRAPRAPRSDSGGSNSSEEHATKNSDSSLEIIT